MSAEQQAARDAVIEEARAEGMDKAADFVLDVLAKAVGNPEYSPCDGTETWDGDVSGTVYRILYAANVLDDETNALRATPPAAAPGEITQEQARKMRDALELILPMAEAWADGKSRSHPDHENVDAARTALAGVPRE